MINIFIFFGIVLFSLSTQTGWSCDRHTGHSSLQLASDKPDWGYAYQNPHYIPDSAPPALQRFHEVFIPLYEARHSKESAYIRENASDLYSVARDILGSLVRVGTAESHSNKQLKHFNQAAKDLVRSCKQLKKIVHGGANAEVYDQMRQIERDYLRVANLSE